MDRVARSLRAREHPNDGHSIVAQPAPMTSFPIFAALQLNGAGCSINSPLIVGAEITGTIQYDILLLLRT